MRHIPGRTGGTEASGDAGDHLAALEDIVVDEFVAAGFARSTVRRRTGIELLGYYRPAKKWDVVVVEGPFLVAAIEFKFQRGPSVGNNFNNRVEEAIRSAVDVWRAYSHDTFGMVRPWLGYFFLLETASEATQPVALPATTFPVAEVFSSTSYQERYQIFCRRLLRERLYDAACLLTSSTGPEFTIDEPDAELTFAAFTAKIAGRAAEIQSLKATQQFNR